MMLATLACGAVLGASVLAQSPIPGGGVPLGPGRGPGLEIVDFGPMDRAAPVLDAPFTAEGQTLTVQHLSDGNRIERRMVSRMARDSRGRTRREQPMPPLGPLGQPTDIRFVTISDPATRVEYLLQPETKTAQRMSPPPGDPGSAPGRPPMPPPGARGRPPAPADIRSESLGTKAVSGVLAEGTRTTVRISAGAFGNVNPIEIVTERWKSIELGIVVASSRRDPVMGDTTFTVTILDRSEPSADLFDVPPDYTVVRRPPGPRPPGLR